MKIVQFANNVDPDEAAHEEPPHLDLHSLCFLFLRLKGKRVHHHTVH